jgi:hypothetical protein
MNIINGQDYDIKLVRMCYNCKDCCHSTLDPNNWLCLNETNKEAAAKKLREKILALSEGYSLENLSFDLEPVPLRAPEKHCPNHTYDDHKILTAIGWDDISEADETKSAAPNKE